MTNKVKDAQSENRAPANLWTPFIKKLVQQARVVKVPLKGEKVRDGIS